MFLSLLNAAALEQPLTAWLISAITKQQEQFVQIKVFLSTVAVPLIICN